MSDITIDFSNLPKLVSKSFYPLMHNEDRFLVLKGGGGSGKSYTVAEKMIYRCITEPGHRILLIRKTFTSIGQSQFKLLQSIVTKWGLSNYFTFLTKEKVIRCNLNGSEFISAGMDDPEKLKSIVEPTIIWYEEPTELTLQDFLQAEIRYRGVTPFYKQSILCFNPISELNWIKTEFFAAHVELMLKDKNIARYIKSTVINDKTGVKTDLWATVHHSTYKDNDFIDDEYVATLLNVNNADPAYGKIYLKGEWGAIGNLVYPEGFVIIDKESYPVEFDEVIYGLDFGNNHPTALISLSKKDEEYYLDEVIYEPLKTNMKTNIGLIDRMKEENVPFGAHIYADIQEGQYIDEIKLAGYWNIKGAGKGQGSIKTGIDMVKRCKIYTNSFNVNINKELMSYKHKENSEGKPIEGEYVKLYDDALTAIRYAISEDLKKGEDLHICFG